MYLMELKQQQQQEQEQQQKSIASKVLSHPPLTRSVGSSCTVLNQK